MTEDFDRRNLDKHRGYMLSNLTPRASDLERENAEMRSLLEQVSFDIRGPAHTFFETILLIRKYLGGTHGTQT